MIALLVIVGLLGLAIGSFLNVVIWRVPRRESVNHPPSSCPICGNRIRWRENVPVLSWLLLRGECRDCGEPISWRYPAVEAGTAMLFVLVAVRFGFELPSVAALPAFLYLTAIAVALSLIDIDTQRLPNLIVLPSYVVALVLLTIATAATGDWWMLARAAIGGVALFAFYFTLVIVYPKGMGLGDVKLAGVLGLFLGWLGWGELVVGAFAPFLLGGIYAVALLVTRRAGRRSGIPFGPWMLAGALLSTFFGNEIANSYLGFVGIT
ncbi:MAG: prepilin peptidase [Salinibacterium sp.]|uniref:Prepilin leader peptidase/N-methyltransferase n=1 Tax=Marisediminicola antarctica TaxID=674079 RepID=A0A7L5AIR7_9MICO|nr:A24 family peptidase [Marisediminicola antarctica]MCY7413086.1 prepilin peptidase [Salinibacterium sp.]QHO69021.1 peptidase A24 [Marisediminicola antarctica]